VQSHVALYRLTGGRIGGRVNGSSVLLLTTNGRKSGRCRTVPLLYLGSNEGYIVVASYGGADRHPGWFLNLQEDPSAVVQVQKRSAEVIASTVEHTTRESLWPKLVDMFPHIVSHQSRTRRILPLVQLKPHGA
jgi:deazaflavin-dependent oxidoreductase (nitroreductase family)